jgi:hypothetical protein
MSQTQNQHPGQQHASAPQAGRGALFTTQPFNAADYGPSVSSGSSFGHDGVSSTPYPLTAQSGMANNAHQGMGMAQSGMPGQMGMMGHMASPVNDIPSVESQPLFDFGLAEELLTTGGAGFGNGFQASPISSQLRSRCSCSGTAIQQ